MAQRVHGTPDLTPEAVRLWLKQLRRSDLHGVGWVAANKRFYGLTRAVRPFINQQFDTPEEREAAFDGLTLALLTLVHFQDIQELTKILRQEAASDRHIKDDSNS